MIYILSVIGLIVVLWLISKGLKRLGRWLECLGDSIIMSAVNTGVRKGGTHRDVGKVRDEVLEEDRVWLEKVRGEIDEMTE